MAKCYHCGKVLNDAWLKRVGAALMGKTKGIAKARSSELARKAALKRWQPEEPIPGAKKRSCPAPALSGKAKRKKKV
jgi:hypothetical protein